MVYRIYVGPVNVRGVAIALGGVPGTEHVYVETTSPVAVREAFKTVGLNAPDYSQIQEWPRMPAMLGSL